MFPKKLGSALELVLFVLLVLLFGVVLLLTLALFLSLSFCNLLLVAAVKVGSEVARLPSIIRSGTTSSKN
jgi:hypothetical protein